jgi:hypothetical protein
MKARMIAVAVAAKPPRKLPHRSRNQIEKNKEVGGGNTRSIEGLRGLFTDF